MKIIPHYPKTADIQKRLCSNLAEFYATTAIERIQKMNLSEEETKKLITMICDKIVVKSNT
ncbi:hypothetical protein [Ruminococcus flavefaciens]|uniref:hypothetical protein n=1 Tax=Ruminococcus flavefaciens TaxID=1265 RepID=UPI000465619C|nr:hypothetical protein [Ruminococcus flavefaciens]